MAPLRIIGHREDIDAYLQEQEAAFETCKETLRGAIRAWRRESQRSNTTSTPMTLRCFQADVNSISSSFDIGALDFPRRSGRAPSSRSYPPRDSPCPCNPQSPDHPPHFRSISRPPVGSVKSRFRAGSVDIFLSATMEGRRDPCGIPFKKAPSLVSETARGKAKKSTAGLTPQ